MSKATEKGLYCYLLEDGRTALTQRNLDYATNEKGHLDLNAVRKDDTMTLNLIANPKLGYILAELYGKEWISPDVAVNMSDRERLDLPYYQHCSILSQGQVYVRAGKFIPLSQYIKKATPAEMAAMLWDVAVQAALAQLSMISDQPVDSSEAV